jgi:hypothetical protein
MCPSTGPLLHGSLTADFNAFRSCFKVRTKRTSEWMPVLRAIQRCRVASLPPCRIARKPRTILACASQRSQGTAASKSRRSALGGWSLGAYPATPEPGNAREPQSSLDSSGVFVVIQKLELCVDERPGPCRQDFALKFRTHHLSVRILSRFLGRIFPLA